MGRNQFRHDEITGTTIELVIDIINKIDNIISSDSKIAY